MLILASDCLSEEPAKLKHQAKMCCVPACLSTPLLNGPNSAPNVAWRDLLTGILQGPLCAWDLAQRAASCETRREIGCSHIGLTLGYNEAAYIEKSLTTYVRNIHGTSLS